jgi:ribonuclease P protein component
MSVAVSASTASAPEWPPAPAARSSSVVAAGVACASRRKLPLVKRANRLSRSRDFDAVHRRGRSVSSRFLVLYWLPQEEPAEPRVGFAIPRAAGVAVERNQIKRRLREVWDERLDRVPPGFDYVLIVRPGLPEAAEANGFAWLGERVDELLDQTGAAAA